MERTIRFEVNKKHDLYAYCNDMCNKVKRMYNVGNYYIRNTATALTKESEGKPLTTNEQEVLKNVRDMIDKNNKTSKKSKIVNGKKVKVEKKQLSLPTVEKKYLNYEQLNAIFSFSNNVDFRSLPIHTAQRITKVCYQMWKGYFSSLKDFYKNPSKYKGMPNFPHYKKNDLTTAYFSNISAIIVNDDNGNQFLQLPSTKYVYKLGKMNIEKLVKVEIKPFRNVFYILLTVKDDSINVINEEEFKVKNVMAIDPGVNNFATITDNLGSHPIIIKGGFIKARNQYFNKYKSIETSNLQQGEDPNNKHKTSDKLDILSLKRDRFFRDCFFKIAHKICRLALEKDVNLIVIGHNVRWKNETNHGKENNQNFVSIPFSQFNHTLMFVGLKYGILVVENEESYTSKASFVDRDIIPTYKKNSNKDYTFSGKRLKRGLYVSKEGIKLNADVNGSLNILRKYCGDESCKDIKDYNKLNSIVTINFKDLYPQHYSKVNQNIA